MTEPLPWPRNAERYRCEAIRAARQIRILRDKALRLTAVDRKSTELLLWQIGESATEIELMLTRAKTGED